MVRSLASRYISAEKNLQMTQSQAKGASKQCLQLIEQLDKLKGAGQKDSEASTTATTARDVLAKEIQMLKTSLATLKQQADRQSQECRPT